MDGEDIEKCEVLIKQWSQAADRSEKSNLRNHLFEVIRPSINQWISSIVGKKGQHLTPQEVQSKSWDCFEYCLKHFKPESKVPLLGHFYSYTRFMLSAVQKNKEIDDGDIDQKKDPEDDLFFVYAQIEELRAFRHLLPPEYGLVFDDALTSLVPDCRQRTDRPKSLGESTSRYVKYREAKRIFKIVIGFLLMR
jgi:hypothetical protein